jgi:hypothetical protein
VLAAGVVTGVGQARGLPPGALSADVLAYRAGVLHAGLSIGALAVAGGLLASAGLGSVLAAFLE